MEGLDSRVDCGSNLSKIGYGRKGRTFPGVFTCCEAREMATERSTTRHVRLYRAALVLYPRTFRRSYREPMVQLFGDCVRTAGAKVWLRAIPDLVRTIPAQRIEAVMAHLRPGSRIAAIAFIASACPKGKGGPWG